MSDNRRLHVSAAALGVAAGLPTAATFLGAGPGASFGVGVGAFALTYAGNWFLRDAVNPWLSEQRATQAVAAALTPMLERLKAIDPTARMNVMVAERGLWGVSSLSIHTMANMDRAPDKHLKLKPTQGAAGFAFRRRMWAVADLSDGDRGKLYLGLRRDPDPEETLSAPDYRMVRDQRQKTQKLQLVYSYPFVRLKKGPDGNAVEDDSYVLGVVNLDSSREKAFAFYQSTQVGPGQTLHRELLGRILPAVAMQCSWQFG